MENHAKNEKVSLISLSLVDDFPEHPFVVKDDESMEQLMPRFLVFKGENNMYT